MRHLDQMAQGPAVPAAEASFSYLSADDRRRFGLDEGPAMPAPPRQVLHVRP